MKTNHIRKCAFQLLAVIALALSMTNCTSRFYLSESEIKAYRANMRTETSANDLWDNLEGQTVELQFQSFPSAAPRIQSSNLLEIFRSIPEFYFLEQTFRQIRLDRLATQLEADLSDWAGERLLLLVTQGGSEVKLQELDRVTLRFLTAPVFSYQPNLQTISFNTLVRLQITGAIHITDPRNDIEKFLGWVTGRDFPDGTHNLRVIVDDYQLQGQVRLSAPFADAIRLKITPTPGSVSVQERYANQNPLPDELKDGVRPIVESRLSSPVNETIYLVFDHFALEHLRLLPRNANCPESELQTTYKTRPTVAKENLDLVARGDDGRLYHARKRLGEWQSLAMIPIAKSTGLVTLQGVAPPLVEFGGDPALVSAMPGVLELVAVATNGELYYAGFRNGEWGNFHGSREGKPTIIAPTTTPSGIRIGRQFSFAQAKPALIATAPGQLEIFALGTDGYIHHVRRINGEWQDPAFIENTVPPASPSLRDPVAVQVGNKIILVYVDGQNRLFAKAFDLESRLWGQAFEIPSQGVQFAPAVVASGEGRVDVVYVGMDQAAYHRGLDVHRDNFRPNVGTTGISYGPETRIGGTLTSAPFLTCSGYRQLELIGRGTDNRIYHNHFVGPTSPAIFHYDRQINRGWQGWEDASEMLFGSIQLRRFSEDVALVATRSGQIHMVARSRGSGPKSLYHNSYNSKLYGIAPWKAVHWRGFEQIAPQRFVGTPALVLSGRELEIVTVGDQNHPHFATLSDQTLSPISFVQNLPVNPSSDPLVLSSSPGLVDMLFIGQQGHPLHLRRFNNRSVEYEVIPRLPAGMSVTAIAATSFADGQIELVGVAQNRSAYHWRYIHGTWDPPVEIASAVVSWPAIVNMGAGELVLLAVGEDQQLRHWKFDNGQWQKPRQVLTFIPVSAAKFGPSAASSWGDGALDIVYVDDNNGRIHHRRILPGEDFSTPRFYVPGTPSQQPSPFSALDGSAAGLPMLTAFGPNRLNVLAKGEDGRIHSNWTMPPAKQESLPSGITTSSTGQVKVDRPALSLRDTTARAQQPGQAQLQPQTSLDTTQTEQRPGVRQQAPELQTEIQRRTGQTTQESSPGQRQTNRFGVDTSVSATVDTSLAGKLTVQQSGPEPVVKWRGFEPISWPGLTSRRVERLGNYEMMATATDQQGRLYINQFFGWRWKGFVPTGIVNTPPLVVRDIHFSGGIVGSLSMEPDQYGEIRNQGNIPVLITGVEKRGPQADEFNFFLEYRGQTFRPFELANRAPVELQPGEALVVGGRFFPQAEGGGNSPPRTARIDFITNVAAMPLVTLSAFGETVSSQADGYLLPEVINFGFVNIHASNHPLGFPARNALITSVGQTPLLIQSLELENPNLGFSFGLLEPPPAGTIATPGVLYSIDPGNSMTIQIRFVPAGVGPVETKLVARTNAGRLELRLIGEGVGQ